VLYSKLVNADDKSSQENFTFDSLLKTDDSNTKKYVNVLILLVTLKIQHIRNQLYLHILSDLTWRFNRVLFVLQQVHTLHINTKLT